MNFPRSTAKWLSVVVAIQALLLVLLWGGTPAVSGAPTGGIPDAGAQRDQIIEQLKATNEKIDKLQALLSSGELQITVRKLDESSKH